MVAVVSDMEDELIFLTIEDICEIFKIKKSKAYELVKVPGFPRIKIGSKTLVPKSNLKKWINENIECEIFLS